MADIADLIQKLSFYQAGGKDPGQSEGERFSQGFNTASQMGDSVLGTIKQVLANKKLKLENEKTKQEIDTGRRATTPIEITAGSGNAPGMTAGLQMPSKTAGVDGETIVSAPQTPNLPGELQPFAKFTPTETAHLAASTAALQRANVAPDMLSVAGLPEEARKRAIAAGFAPDGMIDIKKFNALKMTDPSAPVKAMFAPTAVANGQVPGNAKVLSEPSLNLGERQDQFWQKQWTDLINKNDPTTSSSRSVLGTVGRANLQANRALATLSKPIVTKQEAGNVMADVAGIYQGGAPTQFGMQEQGYHTLYGNLQNALQSITGNPTDVLPTDIKNRLLAVLGDMKAVNSEIINNRVGMLEKTQPNLIKHFPDEWNEFKNSLIGAAKAPSIQSSGLNLEDQQALDWANANPADPRAAAIKQKLGTK